MSVSQVQIGTMIKNGRMDLHLTQDELAEKLDISSPYLRDLERHKGVPSLKLFCRIMKTLNLSADDYVYPNSNASNDVYQKLMRLLTQCDKYQLNVLLATATALVNPIEEQ